MQQHRREKPAGEEGHDRQRLVPGADSERKAEQQYVRDEDAREGERRQVPDNGRSMEEARQRKPEDQRPQEHRFQCVSRELAEQGSQTRAPAGSQPPDFG